MKDIEPADDITARAMPVNPAHGGNPVAGFHYGKLYLRGLGVRVSKGPTMIDARGRRQMSGWTNPGSG